MEELSTKSIIEYIIVVAPVTALAVISLKTLWSHYISVINEKQESDSKNLETLKDVSSVLGLLLNETKSSKESISKELRNSAESIKNHIDVRISDIKKNNNA